MNRQTAAGHRSWSHHLALRASTLAVLLLLSGCAAQRLHGEALNALAAGNTSQALQQLRQASEMEPGNAQFRIDYLNERQRAVMRAVALADEAMQRDRLDDARQHWQQVLALDRANERAVRGLALIEGRIRAAASFRDAQRLADAGQTDLAQESVRQILQDQPQHPGALALQRTLADKRAADQLAREEQVGARAALRRPVTLQFRDASVRQVFEALARATQLNVILDRDVRSDLRTTIFVTDASVGDTIDLILMQNQLEKRVLNSNTLLIYPATAAKQKEYGELKVRSFQLSNIDAAHMANLIKTMLKTRDVLTDPRTNMLVMRDTPEAIAVAERLIAANDLPDPEVMLEVEVLEISSSRMSEIGVNWPTAVSVSTPGIGSGADNALTVGDVRALTRNQLQITPLAVGVNMKLLDSDANLLASPRIRTRNKEKARILVGDKVPVITNLISPQQAGQSSVITGSIQYLDVGIKLEVEPQVYADGDVGIRLNLEVSSVADVVKTASGQAYQIGSRSAQTVLRLKDGETQVLGGLINDQDRSGAQKVPGLGQLPVLGRLFSTNSGDKKKSEIVVSITPHIIRPLATPDLQSADLWSGSESVVRSRPLRVEPMGSARTGDSTRAPGHVTPGVVAGGQTGATAPDSSPSAQAGSALQPNQIVPIQPGMAGVPAAMPRYQPGRVALPVGAVAPPPAPATEPAPAADPPSADKR
jgi:general secretion pathway protein D